LAAGIGRARARGQPRHSYAAGPITEGIRAAYRLFAELATDVTTPMGRPRASYAITIGTPACWDAARANDLAEAPNASRSKPDHVLIDVGLDKPAASR